MIRKLLFIAAIFTLGNISASQLPDEFYVTERWLSWTTTFDIETKAEKLGTVHRKFFSLTPEYHLHNMEDQLISKAKMRFWSLGAIFEVTDSQGAPQGTVEETFSWFFPTFEIVSPRAEKLAKASLNFWGTKWTLVDPINEQTIAELSRPLFRLKNDWTVNVYDRSSFAESKKIHPNMFMVLIAFQVDKEYWAALSNSLTADTEAVFHIEDLKRDLKTYRGSITEIEPTENDFIAVETLTEQMVADTSDDRFIGTVRSLMDLLESGALPDSQKAALYLMLENRLNK